MTAAPPATSFEDRFTPGEIVQFEIRARLHEERTPFQHVQILDLVAHGPTLVLDGDLQSAAGDEAWYHEALVHPALLHGPEPGPRSVLILGGGEGATLREVLRHRSVERVVMVDLDEAVVEACRRHLPGHHQGSFDDPRVTLCFADAVRFLEECRERFDAAVFDLVDPRDDGPAAHLFGDGAFTLLRCRLATHGVLAMQYGAAPPLESATAARVLANVRRALGEVRPGAVFVPSFHAPWGVAMAGAGLADLDARELDERIARRLAPAPRTLDGATILALFTLAPPIARALAPDGG